MSGWVGCSRSKKSGSGWGLGRVGVFERYDWIFLVNLSLVISRYFRVLKVFLGIWGIREGVRVGLASKQRFLSKGRASQFR